MPPTTTCAVCDLPVKQGGLCSGHYFRLYRYGDVRADRPLRRRDRSPAERLAEKSAEGPVSERRPDLGPCLLFTGAQTKKGYGSILGTDGRVVRAHQLAWELAYGPVPDGKEPDHLCRVRLCIRPAHLEAVTHAENVRRALRRDVYCIRHEDRETVTWSNGARACKACRRERRIQS